MHNALVTLAISVYAFVYWLLWRSKEHKDRIAEASNCRTTFAYLFAIGAAVAYGAVFKAKSERVTFWAVIVLLVFGAGSALADAVASPVEAPSVMAGGQHKSLMNHRQAQRWAIGLALVAALIAAQRMSPAMPLPPAGMSF